MENLDLNDDAQRVVVRTACIDDDDESPVLEQICPLWVHNLAATQAPALLLFDQVTDTTETTLLQSHPRRLRVHGVVTPRTVTARSLTWRPLVDMGEVVGVVFLLGSGRDDVSDDDAKPAARARGRGTDAVARIEVRAAPPGAALGSVAVVQSSYSPLAMASGMADPSSYLLYPNPEAHLASMREVRAQLQRGEDVGYVPARELCVTSAFDRLVLRSNPPLASSSRATPGAQQGTRSIMKATCDRDALREGLAIICGVIPTKSPKPILSNVCLVATDDQVELVGTDQEVSVRFKLDKVDVAEPGPVVIPARTAFDFVREGRVRTLHSANYDPGSDLSNSLDMAVSAIAGDLRQHAG